MLSLGPVLVASLIVMAAIAAGLLLGIRALNRRVTRADAETAAATEEPFAGPYRAAPAAPGSAGSRELAPLYYILSVLFWPAGFIIGGYLLRDARTARIGRTCMLIAMALVTAVSALTCLSLVSGAVLLQRRQREERAFRVQPRLPPPIPTSRPTARRSYSPPPTPSVVVGRLGEPVVLGDLVVQVHAVDTSFVPTRTTSRDAGARFVAFDVSFRNEGSRVITTGSHSLKLFDADGFLATSQFSGAKTPQLSYVSLTPGNVVRGWVTFKLPTSAKSGRLQIKSSSGPSRVAEISLSD